MPRPQCRAAVALAALLALPLALHAAETKTPATWRGANPDMLSGGLFSALDADGAFGRPATPPRARAGYADLSKGHPPAVLDARVGANVRVGDDPAALPANQRGQAEPHLARSAINPDLLLAGFQEGRLFDGGAIDCGYGVSRDGGLTWTRALIPNLTTTSGGRFLRATDPVCAIGPQGDLYLQTLGSTRGAFELAAVVVSRSTDNGNTWSTPFTVFESTTALTMPDKNWLAVNDYPSAPNSGRLVATWTNFITNAQGAGLGNPIVAALSDDRGATWTAPVNITPAGSSNQGTQPLFLPDGSLVVLYITFLNPNDVRQFNILCKRSTDGGRTFPAGATTVVPAVSGWDDPDLRDGIYLPGAAVARTSGELYVTFIGVVNNSPRVLVTKSTDQGATWTSPIVVSDPPAGVSVMNPAIATSPDGRTVSAVFMDKRNAPDGRNFVDHYAALSFDGGATWQPNVRLTEMSSDIRYATQTSRGAMLGDYLGLVPSLTSDQPWVAVWCDTRTGDADPMTVRFAASESTELGAWAIARFRPVDGNIDDNDGVTSFGEFYEGTDPRVAEYGDSVITYRLQGGGLAIAHAVRAELNAGPALRVRNLVSGAIQDLFPQRPIGLGGQGPNVVVSSLAGDELPTTPLRPGLKWVGSKIVSSDSLEITPTTSLVTGGMSMLIITPTGPGTTTNTDSRLINLSTRGRSGTGASQMIVGFVLDGNKSMLVRAAGPALATLGVTGALADPRLTFSALASDLLVTNDNWQQPASSLSAANATLFTRVGAFPFAANSLDAALALDLGPQQYTAVVSGANNASGVALVEAYDASPVPGAPANPRLVNLSTRGEVGTGENALIAGFVITGTQPRRVLLRAVGPSLEKLGVTGVLADPVLTVFRGGTELARNDDWEISRSGAAVAATAQRVGAFPLNAGSLDAALLLTLPPGAYSAVVTGVDGTTGIALVEVYDAD